MIAFGVQGYLFYENAFISNIQRTYFRDVHTLLKSKAVGLFSVLAWACDPMVTSGKPRNAPLSPRWRDFLLRRRYGETLKLRTSPVIQWYKKATTNDTERCRNLTCYISDGRSGEVSAWLRTDFHVSTDRHYLSGYWYGFILTNLVSLPLFFVFLTYLMQEKF